MCAKQGKSNPMKPTKTEPKNQTAAVQEIVKQRANGQPQAAVPEPAQAEPGALVVQDATTLGEVSTVTSAGRLMLFNCQTGVYSTHDDGEEVPQDSEFIAHADSAIHGWIRFDPDGGPITEIVGGYFSDWKLPLLKSLPDRDQSAWKIGLSGGPEDPWKQTAKLPLEDAKSGAFFTLSGNTKTTVLGIYRFLNEYRLLRRRSPDALPVIRLASGTYKSKYGSLVHKPILIIVSRVSGGVLSPPDTSTTAALLNDKIPFEMSWR